VRRCANDLSPHLRGACPTRSARAKVGTWTPMEAGLLFRAVGDVDVEWEEVAAAIGPHETAVSCWWRWVLVGELAGHAPAHHFAARQRPHRTRTTNPRPGRRRRVLLGRRVLVGRRVPALPVPLVTRPATRCQEWS
jgi:hypothetical protein